MTRHAPSKAECDPSAVPAQEQESEHDPVEHDRFLVELMKAVDEDAMSEETSASQESRSPVPSPIPPPPERVRYSFD
jgi:hypothetical protein